MNDSNNPDVIMIDPDKNITIRLEDQIWITDVKKYSGIVESIKHGVIAQITDGKITMTSSKCNSNISDYYSIRHIPGQLCYDMMRRFGVSLKELHDIILSL